MIVLPKKFIFAIEAVVDIACHSNPFPVQSKEITQRQRIPQRYLEQTLQRLVKAKILKGVRGPRGGYILARERRRISVGDIVQVIGNTTNFEENTPVSELSERVIRPMWQDLQSSIVEQMSAITIDDLYSEARKHNVKNKTIANLDFTI